MRRRAPALAALALALAAALVPWQLGREPPGPAPSGRPCPAPAVAHAQDAADAGNGGSTGPGAGVPVDVDLGAVFGEGCVDLELGGCVCGVPPKPCLRVTYWEPRLLVHTRQAPSGARVTTKEALQYAEATAWPFPLGAVLALFGFPLVCSDAERTTLTSLASVPASYSSLADQVAWRTGGAELLAAQTLAPALVSALLPLCATQGLAGVEAPGLGNVCLGVWGPLFPRTGWLVHPSEPVGSGAAAFRAAHLISHPELLWGRVAIPAFDFRASTADKMNLVVPRPTPCLRPGTNPAFWEPFTLSPTGDYVWVYWVKRSCCISPTLFDSALGP